MKHLRRYIRQILLESPLSGREKIARAQLDYRDYIRDTLVRYQERSGKQGPNYPKRSTRYDLSKESNDLRRLPKQMWNQMADHQFFKEKIRKFHMLGYAGKLDVQKYFSAGASKNEISCFATEKTDKPELDLLQLEQTDVVRRGRIFLELEGRTTWCGNFDAFTEQLKDATPEQIKNMASSGLAKRPGRFKGSHNSLTELLILDADDFERNGGEIEELILDNWNVKCFWFVINYGKLETLLFNAEKVLEKSDPLSYGRQDLSNSLKTQTQNWFGSDIGQSHDELVKVAALCEQRGIPMKFVTFLNRGKPRVFDFQTLLKVAQHVKDSVPPGTFDV